MDFPTIYTSALNGTSGLDLEKIEEDMSPLLDLIITKVNEPPVSLEEPFQMQISALDSNSYVGVIGIGRISRGNVKPNDQVVVIDAKGKQKTGKILQVLGHEGLERVEVDNAEAGDIVCVTGIEKLYISDTLCNPENIEQLPPLSVDEPTVSMTFQVNDSPFAGNEGKFVTSRNIKDRLEQELLSNVALRVEQGESADKFKVSGRGELHLSVLIENMRRDGFELEFQNLRLFKKK